MPSKHLQGALYGAAQRAPWDPAGQTRSAHNFLTLALPRVDGAQEFKAMRPDNDVVAPTASVALLHASLAALLASGAGGAGSWESVHGNLSFPCERWRSRMTMQNLLQFVKGNDDGCKAERTRCYLQIPKTGSSTVKTLFGLPIVGVTRPRPCTAKPNASRPACAGTVPHCRQTLVTWREPRARFVSAISTIHHRTGRWCLRQQLLFQNDTSLCFRLRSVDEWLRYASVLLDEIETIIRQCTNYREAGPQNLTPEFFHILPQWIFLRLLPSPSAVDLRYVGNVQPTCTRARRAVVNNTGEGRRGVIRVSADHLNQSGAAGARVLSRVDALYQSDLEVWRLLSANGGALNLIA